ncbi:hypothetical protein GCM10028791_44220 [Echinicola sediminis]
MESKKKRPAILVGVLSEVLELCGLSDLVIFGAFDKDAEMCGNYGVRYLGNDDNAKAQFAGLKDKNVVLVPDEPKIREKLHKFYRDIGYKFCHLISPNSYLSPSAILKEGVMVQSFVNISCNVKVGGFVRLNTYCNVMHDVEIGDYTTIAPNAVVLGNVKIGKCCYIGANATILPGLIVCSNTVVGAGAVVTKNITEPGTYVGVPAKRVLLNKR